MNTIEDWLEVQERLGAEVVWLPLDPEIRKESYYNPKNMIDWISSLESGAKYSYVKEFFAAIDDVKDGWPAPLNDQSAPILLRLLEKYWFSQYSNEFVEAL